MARASGCQKPDACEWNWWPDHCQCRDTGGKRFDAPEPNRGGNPSLEDANERIKAAEQSRDSLIQALEGEVERLREFTGPSMRRELAYATADHLQLLLDQHTPTSARLEMTE